jgi:chromosomal replication initiation ATPase DnaA
MTNTKYKKPPRPLSQNELKIANIINAVCEFWSVSAKEMILGSPDDPDQRIKRKPTMVVARKMSIYLVKKHTGMFMPDIAVYFKRSHTTVSKYNTEVKNGGETVMESITRIETMLGFKH